MENAKLIIATSSRALFNLDDSHQIYETEGLSAYTQHQISHEQDILKPGAAFPLVQKLLSLNTEREDPLVEVILVSRNNADTGLRVFNSIQHYNLPIRRAAFSNGRTPYAYLLAFGAHLFLSHNPDDVRNALNAGSAAATLIPSQEELINQAQDHQVRVAFDGDAVLFTDEAERVYQEQGLSGFAKNEVENADRPLAQGPFHGFLLALHQLQQEFPADACPIRTALVTARSAPAHERVIKTLRHWQIRTDESVFLGGLNKGEFLKAFGADIFFDDQQSYCLEASDAVTTGHVPSGVMNT